MRPRVPLALAAAAVAIAVAFPAVAFASHSWNGYHWARTSNPFTLKLGDNVSGAWDGVLATASTDWTKSTVLDTTIVTGGTKPKACRPTSGRVEVCSDSYGNSGWLGLAQIWVSGKHITQGIVKVNNFYMNSAPYNTTAWRNLVMCQEVGHTLGLDHQDENFDNANLGTCMDYTDDPGTNQHPNSHDYAQLVSTYTHLDSTTTVKASAKGGSGAGSANGAWGRSVASSNGGRTQVFFSDLGGGKGVFTFVIWARS